MQDNWEIGMLYELEKKLCNDQFIGDRIKRIVNRANERIENKELVVDMSNVISISDAYYKGHVDGTLITLEILEDIINGIIAKSGERRERKLVNKTMERFAWFTDSVSLFMEGMDVVA